MLFCTPTAYLFSCLYDLNFGQNHVWHKIEVLWGMLKGITWELGEPQGNMMRTCWEHIGNKEEKLIFNAPKGFILFCTWNHLIAYFFYSNQNLLYFRLGECLLLGAYSLNFVLEEWEVYPQLNQQTFQLHTHIDGWRFH